MADDLTFQAAFKSILCRRRLPYAPAKGRAGFAATGSGCDPGAGCQAVAARAFCTPTLPDPAARVPRATLQRTHCLRLAFVSRFECDLELEFRGVTHSRWRAVIIGALSVGLSLLSANAQALPDPTRPSVGYDASLAYGDYGVQQDGPVLQSVMLSPRRKSAIISGVKVDLGGKYADAKLIRISEGEVVLQRGGELQTLKLFPGVEKRISKIAVKPAQKAGKKSNDK